MKSLICLLLLYLTVFQSFAASGRSVAVVVRYRAGDASLNFPEKKLPGTTLPDETEAGAIVRYDITSNNVVAVDTIVKLSTALCQGPQISLDGSRVAFFRWPCHVENNALKVDATGKGTLAVVDISGKNLRDIVPLPDYPGQFAMVDWSADGFINYVCPRAGCPANNEQRYCRIGNTVWRVNPFSANPASTNTQVMKIDDCGYFWRFAVDLEAKRYSAMVNPIPGFANCPADHWNGVDYTWNPTHGTLGGFGGCNSKLSCSGTYVFGFCSTNHSLQCGGGWTGTKYEAFPNSNAYAQTHSDAITASGWAGFPMGDQAGVEIHYFSANSDKWYSVQLMWRYCGSLSGSNQLLINWIDKQAIMTSRNPIASPRFSDCGPGDGAISTITTVGDFWVRPPSTQYDYGWEDTLGTWRQMQKPAGWALGDTAMNRTSVRYVPAVLPRQNRAIAIHSDKTGQVHFILPRGGWYKVSVIDMQGNVLSSRTVLEEMTLNRAMFTKGVYLVRAVRSDGVYKGSFAVLR
jgi:hypothetical protein